MDESYVYQLRLIVIGDSKVGKSSLLKQFTSGKYVDTTITVGVDFHSKIVTVDGNAIKLQLWDTAGQERFRAITRSYYRSAVGGLLVFDITDMDSFSHLTQWIEDAKQCAKPHNPVFVLVGHKSDLSQSRAVSAEQALSYAQRYDMEYVETSAKTASRIDDVFLGLAKKIFKMVQDGRIKLSDEWDGVKRGPQLGFGNIYSSVSLTTEEKKPAQLQAKKGCCITSS